MPNPSSLSDVSDLTNAGIKTIHVKNSMPEPKMRKIKPKTMKGMTADSPMYPSMHFSLHDLPEGKSWKVGGKYRMTMDVKQTSVNEREGEDGSVDFDILAVAPQGSMDKQTEKHEKPMMNIGGIKKGKNGKKKSMMSSDGTLYT